MQSPSGIYKAQKKAQKRPVVLCVADMDIAQSTLQQAASAVGFVVELARDGEEALSLAQDRAPDALLLDVAVTVREPESEAHLRAFARREGIPIVVLFEAEEEDWATLLSEMMRVLRKIVEQADACILQRTGIHDPHARLSRR